MTIEGTSSQLVSDEVKRSEIKAAQRKFITQLGVDPALYDEEIKFGLHGGSSPEHEHELAKAKGLQIGFQTADRSMEEFLPQIQTREDLDQVVQAFTETAEKASTIVRNAMDEIRADLPRQGGPGRTPKLDERESAIVCKEILKLIGRKYSVTKAIKEVSTMCPVLTGKTVGTRTLHKAWDRRDVFLSE